MDSCNWTPSIVIDDEDSILAAMETISTSTNSLERAEFLLILASNLIAKETTYESACTDEELMDALGFTHLAFESTPDTPEHQPVHDHIAQLYSQCLSLSCERATNLDQLEMAIVLSREVYNRHSAHTCELRRVSGNNLSLQIAQHITLTGDTQFIMTLVTMCRRELDFALEQEGENSLERAMALTNMGIALQKCYDMTSDAKLIRQACDAHQLALEVCPQDHSARFIILSSFAASLVVLYKLRPDPAMLKMIYHLHEEVLRSQPPGHPFRAITLGNFSGVLKMLFDKTRERHYIDQAIDLQEERLALRPPGHQQRKVACYNLMTSYTAVLVHWPDSSGDAYKRALDLANTIFEEELSSDHYNFLTLVALCDIHTIASPYQDIALGLVNLEQACQLLESSTLPSYAAYQPLLRCLERVSNRTLTFKSKEVQGQMLSMFSRVADSLPLLAGFALDKEDRLDLLRMTEWLGPASFACSLKAEELVRGLEILELVRGTFWSQAIHLQDPRLEDVPQHLSEELGELMQKLATMRSDENDSDSETSTDQQELRIRRHYLATRASEVILEVRLTPGLERFMLGLPFAQLKQVASAHPVVVLVDSSAGMHAVILRSADTTPECLELPGAEMISLDHIGLSSTRGEDNTMLGGDEVDNDDEVDVACEGDKGDVVDQVSRSMRAMTLSYPSRRQSGGKMAKVLAQMWLEVVKPILTHLGLEKQTGQERSRIHWCLTGNFEGLPVHAAGIYHGKAQECCSDYVVSSYTPTLSALLRAQRGCETIQGSEHATLIVSEDEAPGMSRLPFIAAEVDAICTAAIGAGAALSDVITSPASVAAVIASLPDANIVHFACHGLPHLSNALGSGFCLHDGMLSIARIMQLQLKDAFLAFMCACETTKGDSEARSQTVHLGAAMLFAGYKSVIGTIWTLDDRDGPVIAKKVYEEVFAKPTIDADLVPYVLDEAAQHLRRSGVPPERWATFVHMGA